MYSALIVGGDNRNKLLADILDRQIFSVNVLGFNKNIKFSEDVVFAENLAHAARDADIIIFGLPVSLDGKTVYCPLGNKEIYLSDICKVPKDNALILGGRVTAEVNEIFDSKIIDYTKRDDFAYLNAVPTAEGAIEAAMQKSQKTIHGSLCMVTGFGRCSEILALTLKSMGADVHVYARSAKDLSHCEALGFKAFHLNELDNRAGIYDMVFNSVPFGIFTKECTDGLNPNCIFIDIASAPGGIAEDVCKSDLNYMFLPGLPGKYSPYTAAQIIEKVILKIMYENGKDAYRWILRD